MRRLNYSLFYVLSNFSANADWEWDTPPRESAEQLNHIVGFFDNDETLVGG